MHSTEWEAWNSNDLYDEIAREIDAAYLEDRPIGIVKVAVRDFDLPATVSNGIIYVQIPFPFLLQTIAAGVPEGLRNLETRISIEGGTALSPSGNGRPVYRQTVDKSGVVRSRRIKR